MADRIETRHSLLRDFRGLGIIGTILGVGFIISGLPVMMIVGGVLILLSGGVYAVSGARQRSRGIESRPPTGE